ncbi:MAG: hypothetical protein KAT35_05200 [Candidatus Aenigmarchaeota archaeon]|nr:hypothetical protein [Candidatus Aenigmarchaeota archaeon]
MTEGFCVRCRKMVEMKNEKSVTYKNKRNAIKGECPECGTKVFKTVSGKRGLLGSLLNPG